MRFKVKNFEQFQHYKDRSPPWIKLYNALLDDYEFACLQDASKLHLILIWLLASRSGNDLPFDSEWVGRRINATEKVDLHELARRGFIVTDQTLHTSEQSASNTLSSCTQNARPEREREREGEGESPPIVPPKGDDDLLEIPDELDRRDREFEGFYALWPRKVARGRALRAWRAARKKAKAEDIIAAAKRYVAAANGIEVQFIPYPASWLNGERWLDEDAQPAKPHDTLDMDGETFRKYDELRAAGKYREAEALRMRWLDE